MSRPVGRPAPITPRGAFDLVPRSQTSRAGSLYPSSNGAAASPAGYTLGGAASAAASRSEQQRENELKIEKHKEKEREKYLIKLQEKIKRHSHLNTAPGQSLNDLDAPSSSLLTVRELQHITYTEAAESHKMNESEVQEKLTQKNMAKLQEKIKRYPYLNTSPGQKLNQHAPGATTSFATVRELQDRMNSEAIEVYKTMELEQKTQEKLAQKNLSKLQEKIKKYPYLNTSPGQRLKQDVPLASPSSGAVCGMQGQMNCAAIEAHQMELDATKDLNEKPAETLEPVDKDREMREMRNRLQEKYNSSLKKHPQSS